MKRLIHVPMVHTPGAIRDTWKDSSATLAEEGIAEVKDVSPKFWEIVEEKLRGTNVVKPRFYVEGYTGEPVIVEPGTTHLPIEDPNSPPEDKIIFDFIKRVGGTIEPTEDRSLIEQSIEAVKPLGELFGSITNPEELTPDKIREFRDIFSEMDSNMEELQTQREGAVATNINGTLQDGETGFLFFGGTHGIKFPLFPDIQVEPLDERLPEIVKELNEEIEKQARGSEGHMPHGNNGPEGRA